jgi:hypothetical protein
MSSIVFLAADRLADDAGSLRSEALADGDPGVPWAAQGVPDTEPVAAVAAVVVAVVQQHQDGDYEDYQCGHRALLA